jgi:Tol biopolymer transport system component
MVVSLVAALLCGAAVAVGRAMPADLILLEAYSARHITNRLFVVDVERGIFLDFMPSTRKSLVGVWSPDGKRLAYIRFDALGSQLSITDSWGSQPHQLPINPYPQIPAWSPNGERFAFFNLTLTTLHIWDGSANHAITSPIPLLPSPPTWSPDGTQIVFVGLVNGTGELFIMDADASAPPRALVPSYQDERAPLWSPDGRLIVFASSRESPLDSTLPLFLYDTETRQTRRLTRRGAQYRGYTWSPDGSRLAVWEQGIRSSEPPRLVLINPENRAVTPLYAASRFDITPPDWRADGRIAFADTDGRSSRLIIIDASGSVVRSLTLPGLTARRIMWYPGERG